MASRAEDVANEVAIPLSLPKEEAQTNALGMWIFLISETMLFGGLFLAFFAYLFLYPESFRDGSGRLHFVLGSVNTAILLTSSLCMACAVTESRSSDGRPVRYLVATLVLGLAFLSIKGTEYFLEYKDGLVPWLDFHLPAGARPELRLFMVLYFLTTGLHAIHMTIGLAAIALLLRWIMKGTAVDAPAIVGLYWHFVDSVWVFLYPVLYLIGRGG